MFLPRPTFFSLTVHTANRLSRLAFGASLSAGLAISVVAPSNVLAAGGNVDSDNDGLIDSLDEFPCRPDVSSALYFPAENQFATLYFEDQWPNAGDNDFNDLVLDHNTEIYVAQGAGQSSGQVRGLRLTYNPRAYGALFDNGVAVHLPIALANASGVRIVKRINGGTPIPVTPVAGESDLVISIADNIRRDLFGNAAGQINTDEAANTVDGQNVEITVTFATPVTLNAALAPFDIFLFRTADYTHQIHLPQFSGTNRMNAALFGTESDRPNGIRKFTDARGVPFVLSVPVGSSFPKEGRRIDTLFPDLVTFGQSGGTQGQNFFASNVQNGVAFSRSLRAAPQRIKNTDFHQQACVARSVVFQQTADLVAGSVNGLIDGVGAQSALNGVRSSAVDAANNRLYILQASGVALADGAFSGSVRILDPNTNTLTTLLHENDYASTVANNDTPLTIRFVDGVLYLMTLKRNIYTIDTTTGAATNITNGAIPSSTFGNDFAISGREFFITNTNSDAVGPVPPITVFNRDTGAIRTLTVNANFLPTLSNGSIAGFTMRLISSNNRLFLMKNSGHEVGEPFVVEFDPQTGAVIREFFDPRNDLPYFLRATPFVDTTTGDLIVTGQPLTLGSNASAPVSSTLATFWRFDVNTGGIKEIIDVTSSDIVGGNGTLAPNHVQILGNRLFFRSATSVGGSGIFSIPLGVQPTTFVAGSSNTTATDGIGAQASVLSLTRSAIDPIDNVMYFLDLENVNGVVVQRIRRYDPSTNEVSTFLDDTALAPLSATYNTTNLSNRLVNLQLAGKTLYLLTARHTFFAANLETKAITTISPSDHFETGASGIVRDFAVVGNELISSKGIDSNQLVATNVNTGARRDIDVGITLISATSATRTPRIFATPDGHLFVHTSVTDANGPIVSEINPQTGAVIRSIPNPAKTALFARNGSGGSVTIHGNDLYYTAQPTTYLSSNDSYDIDLRDLRVFRFDWTTGQFKDALLLTPNSFSATFAPDTIQNNRIAPPNNAFTPNLHGILNGKMLFAVDRPKQLFMVE